MQFCIQKCEYLGADAASEEERKLAELVHFPPLNYACYPAVPAKYIVPMVDVWDADGTGYFNHGRTGIGSRRSQSAPLAGILSEASWKRMSRLLAWMLHHVRHGVVVDLLMEKLMRASESYPVRSYKTEKLKSENPASKNEEIEKREVCDTKASEQRTVSVVGGISQQLYEKILMQAVQRKMELEAQGKQVTLVRGRTIYNSAGFRGI